MSDLIELPSGWTALAWPHGWNSDQPLELEQVGYVLLPKAFDVFISLPREWEDGVQNKQDVKAFIIRCRAENGSLTIWEVGGDNIDMAVGIHYLIENLAPDKWKPLAVHEITQFLAFDEKRKATPAVPPSSSVRAFSPVPGRVVQRKHHRITDDHLTEVVKIYQSAKEGGKPPTRAVQEHFGVSHSAAAKWVGTARRKGLLPPAGKSGSQ